MRLHSGVGASRAHLLRGRSSIVERIATSSAAVHVDLWHGGSIVHFGASEDALDNVLARFEPRALVPPARAVFSASRTEWLRRYNGGWQLLTPNAGEECTVSGINHPFHGEVSKIAWTMESRSETSITMHALASNSLTVTRTISLAPDRANLFVRTTLENESSVSIPAMLVEHIALAGGDDVRVKAAEESLWEIPPDLNGRASALRWSSAFADPIPMGCSRVLHLVSGSEGWVELRRDSYSVRVEWDPTQLPYLWYWQERRTEGFPFYGRCDVVGLEPASAAFGNGLSEAIARGDAWWLDAGGKRSVTVEVSLIPNQVSLSNRLRYSSRSRSRGAESVSEG